ncbi:MAG: ABC transporter substrate-binding protein [Alphaproteobacteria bacterium]|nr:ABC transporter substrate-binding protein [Alphaproteobacteria bacterium]
MAKVRNRNFAAILALCAVLAAPVATWAATPAAAPKQAAPPTPPAAAQEPPRHYAIAMVGEPLYPPGFTHFDYANPDAPKGGILKLGAVGTFDSLNPFIVRGQAPFGLGDGMSLIYQSLMARSWDEPFTLYGLIAQSVQVAPDRSSIIFNIDPRAHFSDGVPVTANDVLFSFTTLRDKGRPNHRTYYSKVAYAVKLSRLRVEFGFRRDDNGHIDREMPLIMGLMPVLPEHDWKNRPFNQTSLRIPVGSGPYRIAAMDVGRSITYVRDPHYWGRDLPTQRGLYNFDKIRIDYYRDDAVALQAFKAGQYDMRRETDPTKWATGYDFPAAHDGRVKLERLATHRTEPAYGFVLNTRRALFADPVLRAALQYSFDFSWVNRHLFHDQYKRVDSYFPNSDLAAPPLPTGEELQILDKYKSELPPDIFTTPVTPPTAKNERQFRDNLLKAEKMLLGAGYKIKDNRLYTPKGAPVAFEIMLSDPSEEKVALNWSRDLKRLGIVASVRTVDSAQYQERIASFDYDVTAVKWYNSLSPGNEQMYFWGSAAAKEKGSRNYAGIHDPVVDALATAIPDARTRAELVADCHALDRVLMRGDYIVPLYYLGADDIASWRKLHHPKKMSLYGNVMEAWWAQ